MSEGKPFIHMLRTPFCNYLYDVNTNMFAEVDENTYQYLIEVEQSDDFRQIPAGEEVKQNLAILREQGFLSAKRPEEIRHSHSDLLPWHLSENIRQISLQVTQQCNFRCSYCVYCSGDFELQRNHSSKRMSLKTALTAVDFFAARCGNQGQPAIGFYGGEPLLEFPLIQRVVEYAEEKLYGKKLAFAITTNASLLTVDIAQFLYEHNFLVTISLDGTPETHDRSRRFASDGHGSFAIVRDNIEAVMKQYPDLKIFFNIVVDPRYPCNSLHKLFSEEKLFKEAQVASTLINDQFSVEKTVPGEIFLQQDGRHTFKSYLTFLGAYDRDRVSRVAIADLSSNFWRIKTSMKPAVSLSDVAAPGGPCVAGQMRLFVNVDGNLFPCERVSETSEVMNIGNLWDGIDLGKVDRILNIAKTTVEHCKSCWAFRHCTLCCTHSDNCGELSADLRCSRCDGVRIQVEEKFRDYLWMREFGVSYDKINQEV